MPLGRASGGMPSVTLEEGATPGGPRCPACDEPLFVWFEDKGFGPRSGKIVDRCENCGLVVGRDSVPDAEGALDELLALRTGARSNGSSSGAAESVTIRTPNARSIQASIGAENWSELRPETPELVNTPDSATRLLAKRGLGVRSVRHLATPGMAAMWQTLLNLLTFHPNFATEALAGRLRPSGGRSRGAFVIDGIVTVLAGIPVAFLAVAFEGVAVLAKRGGVIEIEAAPDGAARR